MAERRERDWRRCQAGESRGTGRGSATLYYVVVAPGETRAACGKYVTVMDQIYGDRHRSRCKRCQEAMGELSCGHKVEPGQVYRDCESPGSPRRTLRVLSIEEGGRRVLMTNTLTDTRSRVAIHRLHTDPSRKTGLLLLDGAE